MICSGCKWFQQSKKYLGQIWAVSKLLFVLSSFSGLELNYPCGFSYENDKCSIWRCLQIIFCFQIHLFHASEHFHMVSVQKTFIFLFRSFFSLKFLFFHISVVICSFTSYLASLYLFCFSLFRPYLAILPVDCLVSKCLFLYIRSVAKNEQIATLCRCITGSEHQKLSMVSMLVIGLTMKQ